MSKPVFKARENKESGSQYSGTNNGSVKPKGIVNKLTKNISFLSFLFSKKIISHAIKNINEKLSQGLSIFGFHLKKGEWDTHAYKSSKFLHTALTNKEVSILSLLFWLIFQPNIFLSEENPDSELFLLKYSLR